MFVVGLTGGVGSGKSTVAGLLVGHGALLIDADRVARESLDPQTIGFSRVIARFGPDYLLPEGKINRSALARLVFSDTTALAALNAIVHPIVRKAVEEELACVLQDGVDPGTIVVLMVPLLLESGQYRTDRVVVVDCDEHVAVRRLVESRGWTADEARARMATQLSRSARVARADRVIHNSGDLGALTPQVDALWEWIFAAAAGSVPPR